MRHPRGPQARIGKHLAAVDLSEGQWQKVSLGRSLMREHALLLIMDEPTAALDAHSERRIFERFIRHARDLGRETGAITIVVSHRSSTIKDADVILVLDKGALIQAGSHDDLIRRAGQPYAPPVPPASRGLPVSCRNALAVQQASSRG